ncbi:hypothetical protein FJT64_015011 [Amphibalanus amphitrite]|uniref:Uncharacterized protein n=1 Tax=Amphibalanus amphitrite TaxID=1232801 RepID=A0A6A4XDX7_AMPAM|nr:hypothetical protein FJT64_015011 [Amphibalanus amphitrite]
MTHHSGGDQPASSLLSSDFATMSDAENDSNRAEELHELREQLATALQRITEQQQSIRDLSRRLELSLTSAAAAPGTAGVPVPESADNRGTPAPAASSGAAADGLTGQILDVFVACGDVFNPYQTVKRRMLDWMKRQELSGNCSARDRFRSCRRNQAGCFVHRLSPVKFRPVSGPELELPDNIIADLSSDQLLPYQLTRAVRTGNISTKEACKKIGPLNHARAEGGGDALIDCLCHWMEENDRRPAQNHLLRELLVGEVMKAPGRFKMKLDRRARQTLKSMKVPGQPLSVEMVAVFATLMRVRVIVHFGGHHPMIFTGPDGEEVAGQALHLQCLGGVHFNLLKENKNFQTQNTVLVAHIQEQLGDSPADFLLKQKHGGVSVPLVSVERQSCWRPGNPSFAPFEVGQLVKRETQRPGNLLTGKFEQRFDGPFKVKSRNSNDVTYTLERDTGAELRAHHTQLRPWITAPSYLRRLEEGVLRSKASLRGLYDIRHRHPDVQFLMTSHLSQGCPENLLVLTACC